MTITNINNVIKYSLDNKLFYFTNYSKNFSYKHGTYYSYGEEIAKFNNGILKIYLKTAIANWFFSHTTSKHINNLIRKIKEINDIKYIIYDKFNTILETNIENLSNSYKIWIKKDEKKTECPILLTEITEGIETNCGHIFSKEGFFNWIKIKNSCPYCRNEFI